MTHDPDRGTGRTTRVIARAVTHLLDGQDVNVLTDNHHQAQYIITQTIDALKALGISTKDIYHTPSIPLVQLRSLSGSKFSNLRGWSRLDQKEPPAGTFTIDDTSKPSWLKGARLIPGPSSHTITVAEEAFSAASKGHKVRVYTENIPPLLLALQNIAFERRSEIIPSESDLRFELLKAPDWGSLTVTSDREPLDTRSGVIYLSDTPDRSGEYIAKHLHKEQPSCPSSTCSDSSSPEGAGHEPPSPENGETSEGGSRPSPSPTSPEEALKLLRRYQDLKKVIENVEGLTWLNPKKGSYQIGTPSISHNHEVWQETIRSLVPVAKERILSRLRRELESQALTLRSTLIQEQEEPACASGPQAERVNASKES
jgi:hypothetical protein